MESVILSNVHDLPGDDQRSLEAPPSSLGFEPRQGRMKQCVADFPIHS